MKKASFWLVAVPILVPVEVSVTMLLALMVKLPPLTVNPPVAEATVMSAVPLKETPPMVWEVVKEAALPVVFWLNVGNEVRAAALPFGARKTVPASPV